MKKLLLVLCVVGSGIFVSGQTVPNQPRVTAQHIDNIADRLWRFRGSVRIETDHVVITADEADSQPSGQTTPMQFDVRGNVHVVFNK